MAHYFVDLLGVARPEVFEFHERDLVKLCEHYNVTDPMQLDDHDSKVFNSETKADAWLARYLELLRGLPKLKTKPPGVPCMLLKRCYLPQVLMGEKLATWRSYRKDWKPGQLFAFHDQTNYVIVRLLKISDTDEGWRYDYELP